MRIEGKLYNNPFSQGLGLMFSKKKIVIFDVKKEKRYSLHGWFVFFPLHLYFLNEQQQVVEEGYLKSWSTYKPREKARYIVESPEKLKVAKGEVIDW